MFCWNIDFGSITGTTYVNRTECRYQIQISRLPSANHHLFKHQTDRQTDRRLIYQRRTKPFSSSVFRKGWGVRQYYSISAPESDWAGGLGIQFERSERRRASVMGTVGVESVLHPSKPDRLPRNPIRDKTPRGLSRSPPQHSLAAADSAVQRQEITYKFLIHYCCLIVIKQ